MTIGKIFFFVGITILSTIGIITSRKLSLISDMIREAFAMSQPTIDDLIDIENLIQPSSSFNESLLDFEAYSETKYKQLFSRTTYINNQINNLSDFASAIAEAAGLDQSSQLKMSADVIKTTVLILSTNMGYADMTLNFLCRLAKISKDFKYIVVAQDPSFYNFLQSNNIPSVSGSLIHPVSTGNTAKFRTGGFNQISIAKIIAARIVLELGYNVFFSDVDIGWKKNPLPYLSSDVDLVIQSNSGTNLFLLEDEPNTGFYFLKSNDRSIALLDETIDQSRMNPSLDDQTHFGNVLRNWRRTKKAFLIMEGMAVPSVNNDYRPFTFRILRPYLFQTGQVTSFLQKIESKGDRKDEDVVILHANFMVGHHKKIKFLKSHQLWNLNDLKFRIFLIQWKLNNRKHKEEKSSKSSINYKLALEQLTLFCTV